MAQSQEDEVFEVTCIQDDGENGCEYQCSACNITFYSSVDEHMKEFHEKSADTVEVPMFYEVEEEDPIDDYVESEGIAFVIKTSDGKFECKKCLKTYKSLRRFLDHVKTHNSVAPESIQKLEEFLKQLEESEEIFEETPQADGSSKVNYRCKVCNTIFDSKKKMLLHYPIHRNVARAHNKHIEFEDALLHCKLCNRSLNNEYEMKLHLTAHAENQAQGSKEPERDKKTQTKKKDDGTKSSYPCQYCQKDFKRPHEKVKHERIHTGEKPYSCDICGKKFRVTYCLSLHKKNVHSEERPYVCSFEGCNKRFKSQSVYNHHLNTHGTAKNYKCTFCPKSFKTSVQLAGHKNTHTKPFACNVCSRAFASLYAVKVHMEIHRNLETQLKYVCKICSAQYGRSFALNDHLKLAHPGMENVEVDDDENEHYIIEETPPEADEHYLLT